MKKLLNKPVILQMICVVLIMFLAHSMTINTAYKELIVDILDDRFPKAIYALEQNNATLLGAYMSGHLDEAAKLEYEAIEELAFMWELDEALNVEQGSFDWLYFVMIRWNLDELQKKSHLSEADLAYIEDIRVVNQAFIDLYDEIIEDKGVSFRNRPEDKKEIISIYKSFVSRGHIIAGSDAYIRTEDYEVVVNDQEEMNKQTVTSALTVEEAGLLAADFVKKVKGEVDVFEVQERDTAYVFEKKSDKMFEPGIYNVSVNKDGKKMYAYLTSRSGQGQYSEEKIDATAKGYIEKLVPKSHVLYHRHLYDEDNKLDRITYSFIYFEDTYYDAQRSIQLTIDNHGYLESYKQTFTSPIAHLPELVSTDMIVSSIKGKGPDQVILLRNDDNDLEYRAFVQSNGALYTLVFDAVTGQQKEVVAKSDQYYERPVLK